jgi:hypothetical protein
MNGEVWAIGASRISRQPVVISAPVATSVTTDRLTSAIVVRDRGSPGPSPGRTRRGSAANARKIAPYRRSPARDPVALRVSGASIG